MLVLGVAVAGACGVLARYGVSSWVGAAPWTIVCVNVLGSFLLGLVVGSGVSSDVRTVVGLGFLGGFTTFSTFSVDVFSSLEEGRVARAVLVVALSVVGGVVAAWTGWSLARA
jgi:CrcB protein